MCAPRVLTIVSPTDQVWSVRIDGFVSRTPAKVLNDRFGAPQSNGSVDTPSQTGGAGHVQHTAEKVLRLRVLTVEAGAHECVSPFLVNE